MRSSNEDMTRTTISISKQLKIDLEDEARENKRNGRANTSVSEIVRVALAKYKRPY